MGLISFATTATVDFPLGNNYVTTMTTKINAMTAIGATNAEDALAQSYGPGGLTDQTGVRAGSRESSSSSFSLRMGCRLLYGIGSNTITRTMTGSSTG